MSVLIELPTHFPFEAANARNPYQNWTYLQVINTRLVIRLIILTFRRELLSSHPCYQRIFYLHMNQGGNTFPYVKIYAMISFGFVAHAA